jgi:hypothetical protein
MLLTHDDHNKIRSEAITAFTELSKLIGGLKKCQGQLISAIGAMGHIAFRNTGSTDVEELLGSSRLGASVVLAGTQVLSQMGKELDRRSEAELVQYIKVALAGLHQTHEESDSKVESLFYSQRLRCCLYRLQRETSKIKGCPVVTFADLVQETDSQCVKYVVPLIREMDVGAVDWSLLLPNKELLNEFFDSFLENVETVQITAAIEANGLNPDNLVKALVLLSQEGVAARITYANIGKISELWDRLPITVLEAAAAQNVGFEAKWLLQFPQLYRSPAQILTSSDFSDVVNVVVDLCDSQVLPVVVSRFPQCVLECVGQWTKTPRTDWYCEELLAILPLLLDENPEVAALAVPPDEAAFFSQFVDSHISRKIEHSERINPALWEFAQFGAKLRDLVIARDVQIEASPETKDRLYTALYETIESTQSEAAAGALIGHLASSSHTSLTNFQRSYDFLENFFNEIEILDVPEDVAIGFLHDYVLRKFPHFEITVYTGTFEVERMSNAVRQCLDGISSQKRQSIFSDALAGTRFTVALLLIVTTTECLRLPPNPHFVPFLLHEERYQEWLASSDFGSDQPFVSFLVDPSIDISISSNAEFALFVAAASGRMGTDFAYSVARQRIDEARSFHYYLILRSLLNIKQDLGVFPEILITVIAHLDALPPVGSEIQGLLHDLFLLTAGLEICTLLAFLEELMPMACPVVLDLFEKAVSAYWAVFSLGDCLRIRLSVSTGPISFLIAFDTATSKQFGTYSSLPEIIQCFPHAATRWFAQCPDQTTRRDISAQFSPTFIASIISETVSSAPPEFALKTHRNSIECECQGGDDVFRLRIVLPQCYPLEPAYFEVSSIGTERFTRECRDAIAKEALRPSGLLHAIATWRDWIVTVIDQGRPCPICLSLLDATGEMPKAKCFTCQQRCHASCVRDYMNSTEKKNCPWCRGPFRKPKAHARPKLLNIRPDHMSVY